MPGLLGKRKRTSRSPTPPEENERLAQGVEAIFERHFNARFAPLEKSVKPVLERDVSRELEEDSAHVSDWSGFSSDTEVVEVVEHAVSRNQPGPREEKLLSHDINKEEPDANEKLNLKKDLALQRLIRESHLLEERGDIASSNHRERAMDLRLLSLGSKSSLLRQQRMPMSHRKGIVARAAEKESQRRQEAKDNGIILEKAEARKRDESRRVRSIDMPAVGKWKGGTLKLSKRDVVSIKRPGPSKRGKR